MTTLRQLGQIVVAMLAISGRVTMVGLSRWAGPGGSYRTIQRVFQTTLPWATLLWLFVRTHLLTPTDRYLLVGDECVVTKAGTHTHGLDRFFSSLFGKPVPGVAFFAFALVSCTQRQAFPVLIEQIVRDPALPPQRPFRSSNPNPVDPKAPPPKPRPMRR